MDQNYSDWIIHFHFIRVFGLSTKSLETLGVVFVRPYVRTSRFFLETVLSLLFSETLQVVRACKRKKNVPSAFLIIFTVLAILAKNWPKLAFLAENNQNGGFLLFSQNHASVFPNFWSLHHRWMDL